MRNLLIAEDDKDIRKIYSEFVREPEYSISFARNIMECLDLINDRDIDFAIVDLTLEDGIAWPICEVLCKMKVPYLIYTASDHTEEIKTKAKEYNAYGVFFKPFDIDKMKRVIDGFFVTEQQG